MKHNSLISANGLLHNPLASTTIKSSFLTAIFKPLLMLFLLVMGSSVVWGDCTFTANSTMYFDLRNAPWYNDGAYFIAKFYNASDAYLTEVSVSETSTSHVYSFQIPNRNDIDRIKIDRMAPDHGRWGYTIKLRAVDAGSNDCMYMPAWTGDPVNCNWTTFGSGSITTGCGGAPAGDTFQGGEVFYMKQNTIASDGNSHDFMEHGRCDFNLYDEGGTFLYKALSAQVIPGTDPVMLKFVVPVAYAGTIWGQVKVKPLNPDGSGSYTSTNKGAIPKDGKNYLINGNTMEWGTYVEPVPYTGNLYLIGGACTGQNWNLGNAVLLDNDGHGIYTITRQINAVTGDNSDGFKFLESANWDPQWRPTPANATVSLSDGGKAQDVAPGQTNIVIKKNPGSPDTKWHLTTSGTYTITIDLSDRDNGKMSIEAATPAEPDYQPWSGDSYRDWYLTGDFSNPGVFDAWVQNPSGYKFAADGDNHQKVSITLDPNDASIFHDNSGHKLTRFEIIRQGDWNDPRINKPQFHAATSNCSLQTDWIQPGSNRMSLELTAKSVIEFDIWRWGTAPGSADRKVTVTITPVPQVTVTFMANGETFATQTFDKGGKASIPVGTPARSGHNFNGWDWDFNTTVNENTTIDATWVYKAISSVVLNESTHMTWVGNTDFSLTPTLTPSDAIAKSVAWSSNATGVATVSDGTVHAVAAGEARITCTVTDQFDQQVSAYCDVTVAACEMATENLYSMTVTGYNTSTDPYATLSYLWNESSDNDGPASMTITRLAFQKKDAGKTLYAYDESGTVKVKEDVSGDDVQWILIPVGESYTPSWNSGNACPLYYIKNKATGAYMHRGSLGVSTGNPDWIYSVTNTNATNAATDDYKWFFVYEPGNVNQRCIFVKSGIGSSKAHSYKLHTSNQYNDCTDAYAPKPMLPVGCTADINDYAKSYNNTSDFNYDTYPNPNYKASLMNGSYYRMNTDATVRANLDAALVSGAVITVRLYADANTTVKLQKTDGTEIETVNLSADAEHEYSYTVAYGSELVGATAFIIKAADNHAGIASIVVTRTHAASPENPVLTWDDGTDVTQSALEPAFQRIASSTLSSGAIHYISSDETVATVAADGTVTPLVAGNTTITATIEAEGCYDEASISYDVTLTEPSLQEAIDATPVSGTLTLTHDYAGDAVINKAITIDGDGHSIGDLKIENTGDLTLSSGLTVRDFTICAKAGNTSIQAASGQVRNATNLTCNRNAYFLYTVDPSGQVHYGWYDFTVPFPVNAASGIKGIQEGVLKEDFANEVDYAIMEYLGERKAQGQYPYQKFRGVMQPNQLYSITLDSRYNYNTVRFQKTADGALVAGDNVTLHEYAGSGVYTNLNGVGNGTLHHADAGISGDYVQVYQSGEKTFLTVYKTQYSFVVGTAFMVQEVGTMTLSQATHENKLLAPARQESAPATAIQIAREGQPFSDQLFISASETGGQAYTPGTDLAKAGDLGSANVPQIWTTAYNSPLCVHEAQLINGEAQYNLSLYAPAAGSYTLTSQNIPADYSLYLTQNGTMLTELNGTYTLDLNKGITTEYGLLLVETYKTPTGMEEPMSQESRVKSQKILRGGVLYILHNGKVYNAQGGKVCDL